MEWFGFERQRAVMQKQDAAFRARMQQQINDKRFGRKKAHMTDTRLSYIIDNAPKALAQLTREYANARRAALSDPFLHPAGQLAKAEAVREDFEKQHAQIADDVRAAIGVQRAKLEAARDAKRPAVDQVTYDRKLRQIERLLSAGVPLEQLVDEHKNDPIGLAVLASESPVLARTASDGDTTDARAGDGIAALIEKHGYDGAFGPAFKTAQDEIAALDKKSAYISNAIGFTGRAIAQDGYNPMGVLDVDGTTIPLDLDPEGPAPPSAQYKIH